MKSRVVMLGATTGALAMVGALTVVSAPAVPATTPARQPAAVKAAAKPKPALSFAFAPARVTAKTKPRVNYSGKHLKSSTTLKLQRQFGSAKVWKTVRTLSGSSGRAVTVPAVSMGKFTYRLVAVKSKKIYAKSASHLLYSYGNVSLSTLCNLYWNNCERDATTVGSNTFDFAMRLSYDFYPSYYNLPPVRNSSCRSVSLRYAANANNGSSESIRLRLSQSSADSKGRAFQTATIGSVKWSLDTNTTWTLGSAIDGDYGAYIYLAGSASCYTSKGVR